MNNRISFLGEGNPEQVKHLLFGPTAGAEDVSGTKACREELSVQSQIMATTAVNQGSQAPNFPYKPLQRNQMRLLRLTGQVNGQILGELISTKFPPGSILSKPKPFTCLSYMWGPPPPANTSSHVLISGHPFLVSSNLKSFLACYLAEKHITIDDSADPQYIWVDETAKGAYVWIDQICIDQSNVLEKNAQVSRMDEIYRNANGGSIVWLGDPRADSYLGKGLPNKIWEVSRDLVDRMTALAESVRGSNNAYTICAEHMSPEDMEILCQIVSDMVTNPYWTRMWIVQEVLLSPKLQLMYGPHVFPYETIHAIGSFAYYKESTNFTPPRVYDLWSDKQWFNAGEGMELSRALRWIEGECCNARDKVFAVLGIVRPADRALLQVDYAIPTEHLFADVMRALIVTCIHGWNDSEALHWLGKFLGVPSALAPLIRMNDSAKWDITYINLMAAKIKKSEITIDLRKLNLVELIQFIYQNTEPTSEWYEDQDRKRIRVWLEAREEEDLKEFDEDVQEVRKHTIARVGTGDFVLVPGD
ncbi:heterokaryon incompatibility protein-domain-containing protein [Paraphoma chrysanthemicola]|uniref:Heterokaryon incompatibility protein-domain-containing protein n=1 Tax=Paraphoma chrysanthemicola TaxID=798071 RepID=A0A8K0QRR3_9PLEO|nr:heterokaryon incompatibility protein-domain-containing protein [Paraphoma chrysanthemicola]